MDNGFVIETHGLTKRYGKKPAVDGVDLAVPRGCVFGFAGRNGAGKTTTIRMLLGLLRPTAGSATVLGFDPKKKDVEVRRRIGYVPESHHIYPWMEVREVMKFCAPFYPTWNWGHCQELLESFDLDENQKIKELSRGMVAKVALTLALAHEPALLVLDEPTSGLDAVVRREFLESIVRLIAEEGKTVFMSSHNLADVERVADRIALLDNGKLKLVEELASLKARFRRVELAFSGEPPDGFSADGILKTTKDGRRWELIFDRFAPAAIDALRAACPTAQAEAQAMSLEDIFVALVGGQRPEMD
jgi:ABC-2 type transport system ATP-binding protein